MDNLTNRYIYAVVRHLPKKNRGDVENELNSMISEMLEVRCSNNTPAESDVRAVLTELGTPEELAAKYSGDGRKFLIGGAYFISYKRILKLVIPIVAGAVLLGIAISAISEIAAGIEGSYALFALRLLGQTLGGVIGGAIHTFGIITIIFAVMERSKTNLNSYGDDFLDSLPQAPQESARIGIGEPIFGIIVSLAAAVLLLGVPQIMGGNLDGEWFPLFDAAVLRGLWPFIILWSVLAITAESVAIIEGRYTARLAVVAVVSNLLILGCAAIVFLRDTVMNPYFVSNIESVLNYEAGFIVPLLTNANIIVFAIVGVVAVSESISISVKAWKYGRSA